MTLIFQFGHASDKMKYNIGVNRNVTVEMKGGELFVTIDEDNSSKSVTFPANRWAQFVAYRNEIDESVQQLVDKQQNVKLSVHVGGGWYVSVTSGFACVDIRLFYNHPKFGERPTKTGIALRIKEWYALRDQLVQIHNDYPTLVTTLTCSDHPDHYNQEGAYACRECNPFHWFEPFHSHLM
jgi:hypothetical protein